MSLRGKLIRLSHENPELRPKLLPLLRKEAAVYDAWRDVEKIHRDAYKLIDSQGAKVMDKAAKLLTRLDFQILQTWRYTLRDKKTLQIGFEVDPRDKNMTERAMYDEIVNLLGHQWEIKQRGPNKWLLWMEIP